MDGLAATMMRSEGWRPEVMVSSSVKPVVRPVSMAERPALSWAFFRRWAGGGLDVGEALPRALVGEREDHLLGVVEDDGGLVLALEGLARDLVGDLHQLPHAGV